MTYVAIFAATVACLFVATLLGGYWLELTTHVGGALGMALWIIILPFFALVVFGGPLLVAKLLGLNPW